VGFRLIDPAGELIELQEGGVMDGPAPVASPAPIFQRIWLRELLTRAANRETLRRLVHADPLSPTESLEDDDLIDWLSSRLDQGRLRVVRITRPGTEPLGPEHAREVAEAPGELVEQAPDPEHWVEVVLVDMQGDGISGERYELTTPDGKLHEGTTGAGGVVRLASSVSGGCEFTFPDLDENAWEPA